MKKLIIELDDKSEMYVDATDELFVKIAEHYGLNSPSDVTNFHVKDFIAKSVKAAFDKYDADKNN